MARFVFATQFMPKKLISLALNRPLDKHWFIEKVVSSSDCILSNEATVNKELGRLGTGAVMA
jgi:hypothetical protein